MLFLYDVVDDFICLMLFYYRFGDGKIFLKKFYVFQCFIDFLCVFMNEKCVKYELVFNVFNGQVLNQVLNLWLVYKQGVGKIVDFGFKQGKGLGSSQKWVIYFI